MLPGARLRLPPLAPLGRPADHRRLGLPVDLPAQLRPRLLDRSGGCPPAASVGGHRPHRRRADPCPVWPPGRQRAGAAVCVRRRLRLRPAHFGPRRPARGGAGAAARRPLLLRRPAATPARRHRPAAPPWRQVQLRRPGHLAHPNGHPGLSGRPVRHRDRGRLGGAASQAAAPPRPRQPRTPPDRARHHPARPGPAGPGPDPAAQGAVAVVGRPRPTRLDLAWRAYIRRFDLEHTVRFCKQTLGWTTPRPRHPEQADRWTWLVLAGYTQLRLARAAACDQRLPWERPRAQPRLSPYRVRRGFPRLLCTLGSPATTPKPAGRSPGRPKGRTSGPAARHPAIKKPTRKPRKKATKIAKAA